MNYLRICSRFYSHIGQRAISVPQIVDISLENYNTLEIPRFNRTPRQHNIVVKGPKGELKFPLYYGLQLDLSKGKSSEETSCRISVNNDILSSLSKYQKRFVKSMWGTTQSFLENLIDGVNEGHQIPIRLVGVGYKFLLDGDKLTMKVGHSHLDIIIVPSGIAVKVSSPTKIVCSGADLHKLTQFAAKIRRFREPEPYNGKGIFVGDETIMLKEGKKGGK